MELAFITLNGVFTARRMARSPAGCLRDSGALKPDHGMLRALEISLRNPSPLSLALGEALAENVRRSG